MVAADRLLTLAELDAALAAIGGFEPRPLIAVGVSGGPDSLGLMILVDRWARQRGGAAWGLIVDHRLRPESAAEAETVADWLAARGIPHAVLVWQGDKPATGIQEAARAARYRLLAEWCAARGCLHLLTAHHRDDQAETYLIRRRAKSGVDGLACMSVVRELRQVRLVRPLLGVPKARLAAFLDAEGQAHLRDPSNRNPAFERARIRMGMSDASPECFMSSWPGLTRPSPRRFKIPGSSPGMTEVGAEIASHAAARIKRERELVALLARAVTLHPAGFAAIDPVPIAASGELGERVLSRVAAVLGGSTYPVRRERLARLSRAMGETPMPARTLGGCRFVAWRGRVLALRETARAAPPLTLAPGASALWDQRFAISMPATAPRPVKIGALGPEGVAALGHKRIAADNPLPRLVYSALPAIWDEKGLVTVPHLLWRRTTTACVPSLLFRPVVSLFSTSFTVV